MEYNVNDDTKSVEVLMATILTVAKYISDKLGQMTTMKLQKLCYYSQAWSLAWDDIPIFEQDFEAWAKGPVCPELFCKHCGCFTVSTNNFLIDEEYDSLTSSQKETIDRVIDFYGDKEPAWLSELTHKEPPWVEARNGLPDGVQSHKIITKESMQQYYGGLL